MIGLLRAIAALEVLAAAFMVVLMIQGLGIVLPSSPEGALMLVLAGATFVAAAGFSGIQLWRLRETGRVASIVFLITLMFISTVLLFVRGQPHVMVRLILEGVALVILFSRRAREVCEARLPADPGEPAP